VGYNDVELLYPDMDPWIPPQERITIPTLWVLPPTQHEQLVINVPEMRLYYLSKKTSTVQTYPIGIGTEGWETPLGSFHITEKRPNPSWNIPASLQEKYGMTVMPPGPENPLGEYFMKFSAGSYGVHGTHMPWGVGRLISHGCIRLYPEHIRLLFPQVSVGAKLEVVYEPIKFGRRGEEIFVEVHPDVYKKISDFEAFAMDRLRQYPHADAVDLERFQIAVRLQNGVPTNVTGIPVAMEYARARTEKTEQFGTDPSLERRLEPEKEKHPVKASQVQGAFTLQTASLRNRERARQLVNELRSKGYPSRLEVADIADKGRWYRVLVGDFSTRKEAKDFANHFLKTENLEEVVVRREY
jgi:L,D-transpeptidase ErfK/SrfK